MSRLLPTVLADLPLEIETLEFAPLDPPAGATRPGGTAIARLTGAGHEGLGEDVVPFGDDMEGPFLALPRDPGFVGSWTLQSFSDELMAAELWPAPPEWETLVNFRRWAFQSAALDLALRQAGTSLPEILERPAAPLRFVNSLGLGDEPSFDLVRARLDAYPQLRFKIDAAAAWTPELMDDLAATGAVDVVDFKGQYGIEVPDEDALVRMYERVLERFDTPLLEDPHDLDAVAELIAPVAGRVSYDAPIKTVADITAQRHRPGAVNLKPCRVGDLAELLALYEHCAAEGLPVYSGGMGELGVGRGQAQLLSAMFHADAANDIAPSDYNVEPVPAGLPPSPLTPGDIVGFRWG